MSKFFKIFIISILCLSCCKAGFSQTGISSRNDVAALNEALAIDSSFRIMDAEREYQSGVGFGNYGTFSQLFNTGLIGYPLVSGNSSGYYFTLVVYYETVVQPSRFYLQATPQLYKRTGIRSFYCDQTGVIRGGNKRGGYATANDPPIF
jgi:hypothetical protein